MLRALTYSLRTLGRSPTFTLVALLSLSLGIGATTAIFSLMDQVLFRSLPVRDPERLVILHRDLQVNGRSSSDDFESVFSYPMYRELRDHDPAFSGVIARASAEAALLYRGNTKPASAELVSGNFFQVLGVPAAIGRVFTASDDLKPDAHPVVVLSHSYWVTDFGSDPNIVNRNLTLNGRSMLVIGVAAPSFRGLRPGSTPNLYVPLAMQKALKPTWDVMEDPLTHWLNVFARLQPGYTLAQAQAATDVSYHAMVAAEFARFPRVAGGSQRTRNEYLNHRLALRPATQGINGLRRDWEKPLVSTMAMVSLVLLIACANVASLLLARASGRQREMSIRLALGASRWKLAETLVYEAVLLSFGAAVIGVAGAYAGLKGLLLLLPQGFGGNWVTTSLNWHLLVFSMLLAVVCCLLFGLLPALQSSRGDVATMLKDNASQSSATGNTALLRKVMVTGQVALSLTLLVGACLFSKSLFQLLKVNLGFHTERLIAVTINATQTRPQASNANSFYRELEDRIAAIPGVAAVGAGNSGPFSGGNTGGNITVEGYRAAENENMDVQMIYAGPGFFHALGIPLLAGRDFAVGDNAAGPKAVIVNQAFVKRFFRSKNPLGFHLLVGSSDKDKPNQQIVGVSEDIRKDMRDTPSPTVFFPYQQWSQPDSLTYYVRTSMDEKRLAAELRRAVRALDPTVPLDDPKPLTLAIRDSLYSDRLLAFLAGAFAVLATLLAAVGLYGVVGYVVARRTGEIGIRMAIGALPGDVLRMVLFEAARMVAAGIVAGLAGSFLLGRLVRSQLFGVSAADPFVTATAVTLLILVTIAAALLPAWKASRLDPLKALKYE